MIDFIWDFKCDNEKCYFYTENQINKCKFYVGTDAGPSVMGCKERTLED